MLLTPLKCCIYWCKWDKTAYSTKTTQRQDGHETLVMSLVGHSCITLSLIMIQRTTSHLDSQFDWPHRLSTVKWSTWMWSSNLTIMCQFTALVRYSERSMLLSPYPAIFTVLYKLDLQISVTREPCLRTDSLLPKSVS